MSSTALVPMFAPDGTLGDVPPDRVQDALSRGFKQGVNVVSKDGQAGAIPIDKLQDATRAGMTPLGATTPRKQLDDRTGFQRFLDSAGIPRQMGTMSDVGTALQNMISPQASPTDPGFGQTLPVVGPAFRAQRELYDQPGAAAKAYGSIPFVGPPGYRAGQQLESGDYAGAAGSALNILTQLLGMKPTNLASNIGNATQEAGNLAVKAAPVAGQAADVATTGAGIYEAISHGDPRYLLSALLHRKAGTVAESGVSGLGSFLQRAGSSINPDVPAQFGNPAFSSASITTESQQQREAFLNSIRTRLALPPGPTELGPSSLDATQAAPEGVLPAARQVVRDANTGQLRDQYTTSVASPNQSPYSIVGARALKQPTSLTDLEGYKQNQAIQSVRDLLERQDGVGATEADARMAEYAKKPWENEKTSVTVPEKITVGSAAGAEQDTAMFNQARKVLGPNASISQVAQLAQKIKSGVVTPGNGIPADAAIPQEAAQYVPEVVNNSSDLLGLLQKSLAAARARK